MVTKVYSLEKLTNCHVYTASCVQLVIIVSVETNLCAQPVNIAILKDEQLTAPIVTQVSTASKRLLQGDPKI